MQQAFSWVTYAHKKVFDNVALSDQCCDMEHGGTVRNNRAFIWLQMIPFTKLANCL